MIGKEAWTNDMRVDLNTRNENWDKLEDLDNKVDDHLAEYVSQLAQSGYQKLPGGLILQWGLITGSIGANTISGITITFPIAFPNQVLYFNGSASPASALAGFSSAYSETISNSKSQGKVVFTNGATAQTITSGTWLAVGF